MNACTTKEKNIQPMGIITTTACSPRVGLIALAMVKRTYLEVGFELFVGGGKRNLRGVVMDLPFS